MVFRISMSTTLRSLLMIFLFSLVLGAGLQAWLMPGAFLPGWLAAFALLMLCGTGLWGAWKVAGGGQRLAWIMIVAFGLRLGFGVTMSQTLPSIGYPQPEQQAGYLSKDAFARDTQAWQLASSARPLTDAFVSSDFFSDQYGGLLALSALVYRSLSPDAHRAYLMIILAAAFAALGIPFFWSAVRRLWNERTAMAGAWILALYPESVFWGASQMREPFLISLIAVSFWGAVAWRDRRRLSITALAFGLGLSFLFSSTVALATLGVLAFWIWLEILPGQEKPAWQLAGWLSIAVGAVGLVAATWGWLRSAASLDLRIAFQDSGWIQYYARLVGERWQVAIIVLYGLMRPLLPSAVIEPSILSWKLIFTWRALGWYLILPLLIYGLLSAWRIPDLKIRRQMIWTGAITVIWILVASARGGGDASDNPRYRVIFLVWMALLAGWAWDWAKARQFRWLIRWGLVDAIFLLFFTQLYLARYTKIFPQINLFLMMGLIGVLSAVVLVGGWVSDRRQSGLSVMLPSSDHSPDGV